MGQDKQAIHLRLPIPNLIPNAQTGYRVEDGDILIFPSRKIIFFGGVVGCAGLLV